jgi:hypothetical protein
MPVLIVDQVAPHSQKGQPRIPESGTLMNLVNFCTWGFYNVSLFPVAETPALAFTRRGTLCGTKIAVQLSYKPTERYRSQPKAHDADVG